jgi:hypothetical protein
MNDRPGLYHVIQPLAVYDREAARSALGLKKSTLIRELKLRRLRYSKRGGRIFILGKWLLEWIVTGERSPAQSSASDQESEPHTDDRAARIITAGSRSDGA